MALEKATLAAGCFWGVQHILDEVPGVKGTRCGYIGGHTQAPTYRDICNGDTGHAEAVEVEFDPQQISYGELLKYFWRLHDPTQMNRQGVDVGSQYRSAIFTHSDEQRKVAEKSKAEFDSEQVFNKKAVTQIIPAPEFFAAEDYHQKYFVKHPDNHVCHVLRPR
jgi:methionine-S-sulfoxide reductase